MIAIIVNKKAKNADYLDSYLQSFDESQFTYDLFETDSKDLSSTIKDCVLKYSIILIGGGDGSIRSAAQVCANTSIKLGVLPLGTMNHLVKELGLPQNPKDLTAAIKSENLIQIDLGEVNGFVFINNSSIGFYPKFAQKRDRYSKFYNKWLSYIPSFIESFKKHPVFKVRVKSSQLNRSLNTSFLMVSNNIYSLKFPITITRDSFNDALLGLYYFKYGKINFIKILKSLFNNKKNFEILKLSEPLELHFPKEKNIHISLDGDTLSSKTPLLYKSLPKALNLLMNPS
ncbi:MAG: diacylglycerol kinase [Tatlockia sp.]|nr:diacylglycerol kinase [Tatlockia sp.]